MPYRHRYFIKYCPEYQISWGWKVNGRSEYVRDTKVDIICNSIKCYTVYLDNCFPILGCKKLLYTEMLKLLFFFFFFELRIPLFNFLLSQIQHVSNSIVSPHHLYCLLIHSTAIFLNSYSVPGIQVAAEDTEI